MAASVSASAARSASLKYEASRHAASVKMRSSGSPSALSSRECMSQHTLQPLIWLARSATKSSVASGTPLWCLAAAESFWSPAIAPGTVITGLSIRGCMSSSTGVVGGAGRRKDRCSDWVTRAVRKRDNETL